MQVWTTWSKIWFSRPRKEETTKSSNLWSKIWFSRPRKETTKSSDLWSKIWFSRPRREETKRFSLLWRSCLSYYSLTLLKVPANQVDWIRPWPSGPRTALFQDQPPTSSYLKYQEDHSCEFKRNHGYWNCLHEGGFLSNTQKEGIPGPNTNRSSTNWTHTKNGSSRTMPRKTDTRQFCDDEGKERDSRYSWPHEQDKMVQSKSKWITWRWHLCHNIIWKGRCRADWWSRLETRRSLGS